MTDPIRPVILFEAQATQIPREVYDEVAQLWADSEFGNDYYYYSWTEWDFAAADEVDNPDSIYSNGYPAIAKYLRERGVDKCLIHWWW